MTERRIVNLPLNRAEGDLEIRVAVEAGYIVDAWSSGTLYRGFENMLNGRAALDALVMTPRICGICTTTHLYAAAKCLDAAAGVTPADNGIRVRNIALLVEHVQSDVRQALLMFMPDFVGTAYAGHPLHTAAAVRFAPLRGSSAIEAIRETKRILEIIAILGGQWPHSSFMVPGGVTNLPSTAELTTCRSLASSFRKWYEKQVLGCSIARWNTIDSLAALEAWLAEAPAHAESDLGWLIRLGRTHQLDRIGSGHGNFLSYGLADLPTDTVLKPDGAHDTYYPAGFMAENEVRTFAQDKIGESIAASHFEGYAGLAHPFQGMTHPLPPTGSNHQKYSYAKAPRYDGAPAETGPLAEALVAGDTLISDWVRQEGPHALVREFARLSRPARLIPLIEAWITELIGKRNEPFIVNCGKNIHGEAFGLINAARGALGHWAKIRQGQISHYQIITPTAWNGSPRDDAGVRGPWEEALIGTPLRDPASPVEAGHVIRSFDPCLVCTVHAFDKRTAIGHLKVGG